MGNQAFQILGIAPTNDGRAIRAAFLRIARIYHPDRFVGVPDDVRQEAERRMKEATAAYELLQSAAKVSTKKHPAIDEKELRRRAKRLQDQIEARRLRDERDRARWLRWEAAEARAREAAELEAEMASRIGAEAEGATGRATRVFERVEPPPVENGEGKTENGNGKTRDPLGERLDAARRGVTNPLVPRRATDG
jgi:curved DNA-binding protein CbpA